MARDNSALMQFVTADIQKYDGIRMPLKASLVEKALVRKLPMDRLHPNPDDEFCMPQIGPNYSIISGYEQQIRNATERGKSPFAEPLMVEKMRPDGYLILNGHHRWAAARNMGLKSVPVNIINPTHEIDIKEMLANSKHDRRVSFDLDEVVFRSGDSPDEVEKGLGFPFNRHYKDRLRIGIPALFLFLTQSGYDIWVYTSKFYSLDYIQRLFKHYHVTVDGVVTCRANRKKIAPGKDSSIAKLVAKKYPTTITVDNDSVLFTHSSTKEFEQFDLSGSATEWSKQVISIMKTLNNKQQQEEQS